MSLEWDGLPCIPLFTYKYNHHKKALFSLTFLHKKKHTQKDDK